MEFVNKIIEGDCITVLPSLPEHSVDMILCDLPYGITQNNWDTEINLEKLWMQYKRIIKPHGVIALTGQHRFTGTLINSNPSWFKYKIVWIKSKAGNFLNANKQPLRRHEDICIFYNKQATYYPQKIQGKSYNRGIRKDNKSGSYGNFGTFHCKNMDGKRFPSDVLFFEENLQDWIYCTTAEVDGTFHPTQKPVALGRWLIRTYSRPGEIILDNACGSGSFLVAAALEQRRYIGIEKNDRSQHMGRATDYIAIARERIAAAEKATSNIGNW
ncbi:site-specific DNA-methyltransferase [Pedobacter sp. ISL-68]|uniref:DNA-methyltransferase n=1 Tax=unclassified Pedobacter TaxID=2628915 RepID=UPI001BEC5C71|nr:MULTISPECIES: site-specific DNA-methyltransferase [unclassified Pedobacter]MBT2561291.1 site-specific DNA-methyltransferase [Pedobacter sp. ISL-64]MBT2590681.1 site-specific DNA-methyltransferase [Pedobacter sp. ISL-68]